jgi:hypothetical protein
MPGIVGIDVFACADVVSCCACIEGVDAADPFVVRFKGFVADALAFVGCACDARFLPVDGFAFTGGAALGFAFVDFGICIPGIAGMGCLVVSCCAFARLNARVTSTNPSTVREIINLNCILEIMRG